MTTWDAFYPLHPQAGLGSALYQRVKDLGWGKRWGDQEPKFWQFSANGLVAGMQIDVDAFSGTREELYALAEAEPPDGTPEPVVPPKWIAIGAKGALVADGVDYSRGWYDTGWRRGDWSWHGPEEG